MPKATEGEASGLINNGRRLFLLGVAGTAVVLTGCGGWRRCRPRRHA